MKGPVAPKAPSSKTNNASTTQPSQRDADVSHELLQKVMSEAQGLDNSEADGDFFEENMQEFDEDENSLDIESKEEESGVGIDEIEIALNGQLSLANPAWKVPVKSKKAADTVASSHKKGKRGTSVLDKDSDSDSAGETLYY